MKKQKTVKHKYDVFISHTSEDKKAIVFPLTSQLASLGVKVWFDQFELKIGDSLSRSIDKGLAQSRYGIVIISPSFLKKDWPEYELKGLTSKEIHGEKVILPIWHKIQREDVLLYSPTLADKYSLDTSKSTVMELALSIIQVVRHDIFENILRKIVRSERIANLPLETYQVKDICMGSPRHDVLQGKLINRIKISHKIFSEVLDMSIEETIYSFRCDENPEKEVEIWERMGTAYLEATYNKNNSFEKNRAIFSLLLDRSQGPLKKKMYNDYPPLSTKEVKGIIDLYES